VPEGDDFAPLRDAPARFAEAMDDDFNTAAALGHLFDAVRALNRLAPGDPAEEKERAGRFLAGYALLKPLFGVLGLLQSSAEEYFRGEAPEIPFGAASKGKQRPEISHEEIERRIEARKAARARKDFAEADRIRKELDALGVLLEDSKAGTTWKYRT
jgi:cysteinyl-tRNA synthetase